MLDVPQLVERALSNVRATILWMRGLFIGFGTLYLAVIFFDDQFHWLLLLIFAFGIPFAIFMRTHLELGQPATASALPEPKSELQPETEPQPAPQGAPTLEGASKTMPSPSNHPLAGKTGVLSGIAGLILDLATATALLYILAGWLDALASGVPLLGLVYSIEIAAIVAAYAYYRLAVLFSVNRERSRKWANVDTVGTVILGAVLVYAAASFHPMVT